MNTTATLFDAGELIKRPRRRSALVDVKVGDDKVTGVGGVVLWGPMLDRLNLVGVADERQLRPIGPGGYTGGECYRALVEILMAGGDVLSDRSLLEGPTQQLRGAHVLPSHTTMFRFCAGADLGRAQKAAAVNRTMLARAWAMGAGPTGGVVTIDPDATPVGTYGPGKEGSKFSYRGEVGLSPLIGICGETGDVLAIRARAGNAHPGRGNAHNTARWVRHFGLPLAFKRCRGKRLRLAFLNVAARVVNHAGGLELRLPRSHAWADAFIEALTRIRALPAFA